MSTVCTKSNASSRTWTPLPDRFIHDHLVEMFPLFELNCAKSAEIFFVDPRRKRHIDLPPLLLDIARVDSLKILGVTFTRNLSASEHIGNILKSCSQSLYALRLLRAHGLCDTAIQTIFRAVIIAKLTYTQPAPGEASPKRPIVSVLTLSFAGQNVAATMTLIYHCLMNCATMLTNNYLTMYEETLTIPYIISSSRNR